MKKKDYTKPIMQVVELRQKYQLLTGSPDVYGMNNRLQEEEVDEGW
jgi:hypothetical protein